MDTVEMDKIVTGWIAGSDAERGSAEYETHVEALDEVMDWMVEGEGERLWEFVLAAYNRDLSDKVIAMLAAGPLEDLLAKCGVDYIDRVEELARKDPRFNYLLGGVWRNSMTDDVWQRVQAIRNNVW
jgi:hypothetical protein